MSARETGRGSSTAGSRLRPPFDTGHTVCGCPTVTSRGGTVWGKVPRPLLPARLVSAVCNVVANAVCNVVANAVCTVANSERLVSGKGGRCMAGATAAADADAGPSLQKFSLIRELSEALILEMFPSLQCGMIRL
jgi:hypothetical protein